MRRSLSLVLLLALLLLLTPAAIAAPEGPHLRTDEHITYINGVAPGKFSPNGKLTRAETATMIARLLDTAQPGPAQTSFPDVQSGDWFYDTVTLLTSWDVLRGYPDGSFRPNGTITRAEFVTILSRLFEPETTARSFPDVPGSHWAYAAVQTALAKGWVSGYPDGTFRPDNSITRAEAVTAINNVLGRSAADAETRRLLSEGGVRCFYDVALTDWFYPAVTEASVPHTFTLDGAERWTGFTYVDCGWPEGYPRIEGKVYFVNANRQFAEPDTEAYARSLVEQMTLREKVCQLLVVWPESLTGTGAVTAVTPQLAAALKTYPVGGVVLMAANLKTPQQVRDLTSGLQLMSYIDLFICVDEEGGRVGRLMSTIGTTRLNNMYSYRYQGTPTAYANGVTLGNDVMRYGFNVDFAPVADVWSNPANTAIGDRAYSDDYDEAATLISAAVQGFRSTGVICCLKHFPGHGSTVTDSHYGFAVVDKTLPQLRGEDLKPFAAGIDAGAEMVMTGHIIVPSVDPNMPATLSYALTTELLRNEMGFKGVVVTDALRMTGAGNLSQGEKAVQSVLAGADLLLGLTELPEVVAALENAVQTGRIPEAQLDAAVTRILTLKLNHDLISMK